VALYLKTTKIGAIWRWLQKLGHDWGLKNTHGNGGNLKQQETSITISKHEKIQKQKNKKQIRSRTVFFSR
jgi:hypothetical protein